MRELTIYIVGTPVPQGSKVANHHAPGVRDANAKKLKPWRAEVAGAVADRIAETGWSTLDEACEVEISFFHQRPGGHYGTGRNAGVLKASAPRWKSTAPDADKLARSILDSLTTARAFRDDGRVARLVVEDRWADQATGARITVRPLTVSPADASSPVRAAGEAPPQEVLFR